MAAQGIRVFGLAKLFTLMVLLSPGSALLSSSSLAVDSIPKVTTTPKAEVRVDPRVELVGIIFRLAGNSEYDNWQLPMYELRIVRHFYRHRKHPMINLAAELHEKRFLSHNAPVDLAIRLPPIQEWSSNKPLVVDTNGLDLRWDSTGLRDFLNLLPKFVVDSNFEQFLRDNENVYAITTQRAQKMIANIHFEWFDEFFGQRSRVYFHFVPMVFGGTGNYGLKLYTARGEELYCLMMVPTADLFGKPKFPESWTRIIIHEFAHSYANPAFFQHLSELESVGPRWYAAYENAVRPQGYGTWQSLLGEGVPRASEILYASKFPGQTETRRITELHTASSFPWVGPLADLLRHYETNRVKYPTIEAFYPQIVNFFKTNSSVAH